MILSYKLCINILLEPITIDIKRTQTTNISTQNCAAVQMSQEETGIMFLLMNVKRFKKSFSVVLFYIQLYTK